MDQVVDNRQVPSLGLGGEALRQREAFNFALFQYSPAPSVVVDRDGCVVKSNLARRRLEEPLPELGAPLYQADGDPNEQELRSALQSCIEASRLITFPEREIGRCIFSVTMCPLPEGAIVITEDITERKQAEAQLVEAQKLAALGTLVAGIAHEISNPNNVMLLNAEALDQIWRRLVPVLDEYRETMGDFKVGRQSYAAARDEVDELLDGITHAAQRVKRLTGELKTFARREPKAGFGPVDMNKVVESAAMLMAPVIRKATRVFTQSPAPGLPSVHGNAQRLEQVIVNLLANACEALESADGRVTVETAWNRETRTVKVIVSDTGIGLAPDTLARLKDPFFTTKHDTGGTGLGLSISQTIVESHKGRLDLASEPGRGTTVTLSLPVADEDANPTKGSELP